MSKNKTPRKKAQVFLLEEKVSSETFIEVYPIHHARNYCLSLFYSLGRKGKDAPKELRAKKKKKKKKKK